MALQNYKGNPRETQRCRCDSQRQFSRMSQGYFHLENSAYNLVPGKLSSLMGMGMKSGLVGFLGEGARRVVLCSFCQIRYRNFSRIYSLVSWPSSLQGPAVRPFSQLPPLIYSAPPPPHPTPSRARPAPLPAGFEGRLVRKGHGHSAARSCGARRVEKAGSRVWAGNCREVSWGWGTGSKGGGSLAGESAGERKREGNRVGRALGGTRDIRAGGR